MSEGHFIHFCLLHPPSMCVHKSVYKNQSLFKSFLLCVFLALHCVNIKMNLLYSYAMLQFKLLLNGVVRHASRFCCGLLMCDYESISLCRLDVSASHWMPLVSHAAWLRWTRTKNQVTIGQCNGGGTFPWEQNEILAIQWVRRRNTAEISHQCFSLRNRPVEPKHLGFIWSVCVHPEEKMTFNCCEHNGCAPADGFTFRAWNGIIYWTHSAFVTLQNHE